MIKTTSACLTCSKPLKGRSDKKFCNDYCRHFFHNQNRGEDESGIKNINHSLKRNRKIIKDVIAPSNEPRRIRREDLLERGFSFKYITHERKSRAGSVYRFCYDYGYLSLDNEYCLLVRED